MTCVVNRGWAFAPANVHSSMKMAERSSIAESSSKIREVRVETIVSKENYAGVSRVHTGRPLVWTCENR
jgi:hypothetical protein